LKISIFDEFGDRFKKGKKGAQGTKLHNIGYRNVIVGR